MTAKTQNTDSNGRKISRVFRPSTTTKKATGGIAGPYENGDVVRVVMAGNGWIKSSTSATSTADTSDMYMPSGHVEYFKMEATNLYIAGSASSWYSTLMV